jgi:orotate phosphoribosyltransferase-like protein
MAAKVSPAILARILYLRNQGLTQEIIGIRLGLATRTVRLYLAKEKKRVESTKVSDDVS